MRRIQLFFALLFIAIPLAATKYAGEVFSLSVGVENMAMGNTGLSLPQSEAAGWWNPALLAFSERQGVELMYSSHFEGLLKQNQASVRALQNLSFTLNHLAINKVKLTKLENENEEISADNRPYIYKTVSNQDFIFQASFARSLRDDLAIGISPKIAYRSLAEHNGYGLGADLGLFWKATEALGFGVNLRDFFGTRIVWENKTHEIANPTLDLELGYDFKALSDKIPVHLALRTKGHFEERGEASTFSSQYAGMDVHAGVMLKPIEQLKIMCGYDIDSLSAGMGIELRNIGLNYAFKAKAEDSLGHSQRVSLTYSW